MTSRITPSSRLPQRGQRASWEGLDHVLAGPALRLIVRALPGAVLIEHERAHPGAAARRRHLRLRRVLAALAEQIRQHDVCQRDGRAVAASEVHAPSIRRQRAIFEVVFVPLSRLLQRRPPASVAPGRAGRAEAAAARRARGDDGDGTERDLAHRDSRPEARARGRVRRGVVVRALLRRQAQRRAACSRAAIAAAGAPRMCVLADDEVAALAHTGTRPARSRGPAR